MKRQSSHGFLRWVVPAAVALLCACSSEPPKSAADVTDSADNSDTLTGSADAVVDGVGAASDVVTDAVEAADANDANSPDSDAPDAWAVLCPTEPIKEKEKSWPMACIDHFVPQHCAKKKDCCATHTKCPVKWPSAALPNVATEASAIPPVTVTIPAGTAWVGLQIKSACQNGSPVFDLSKVWLDEFAITKYEVTVAQYRKCVQAGACTAPGKFYGDKYEGSYKYFCEGLVGDEPTTYYQQGSEARAVNCVDKSDAQAFCAWLGEGWSVPSGAAWYKAARGGCELYPLGKCAELAASLPWWKTQPELPIDCRTHSNSSCRDQLDLELFNVGSHPLGASPYGVQDMLGGVAEFVVDLKMQNPPCAGAVGFPAPDGACRIDPVPTHDCVDVEAPLWLDNWHVVGWPDVPLGKEYPASLSTPLSGLGAGHVGFRCMKRK